MIVKAIKEFFDDGGHIKPKQLLDVTDHKARELIELGLVVDVQGGARGDKRVGGPISSKKRKHQTGKAAASSSSQAGRAQPAAKSSSQQPAKTASRSSASTSPGGSRKKRQRSTAATVHGGANQKQLDGLSD